MPKTHWIKYENEKKEKEHMYNYKRTYTVKECLDELKYWKGRKKHYKAVIKITEGFRNDVRYTHINAPQILKTNDATFVRGIREELKKADEDYDQRIKKANKSIKKCKKQMEKYHEALRLEKNIKELKKQKEEYQKALKLENKK